tara:strand:+ start:170 stop:1360 length:1191 start_codon:yes stop_codon:yes gene_type:complete
MKHTIHTGDVANILPTLDADSFDAVLCDPPYGLNFMGKKWDHGVPSKEVWAEVLRVVKPGAHVMAFGGTRTFHRLTCAIEDSGFAIRDCLSWLYGSGFPKSHNVSKAIDKAAGVERETGPVDPARAGRLVNQRGDYDTDAGWSAGSRKVTIDPPATDAAKTWQGYGTALKPAWEPVILAMKATDGTFAANALEHGVAGLNIDGSRIPATDKANFPAGTVSQTERVFGGGSGSYADRPRTEDKNTSGRWPANLILDEEAGAALDAGQPVGKSTARVGARTGKDAARYGSFSGQGSVSMGHSDSGGPSRFFYCAKAPKKERGDSKHPTLKPLSLTEYLAGMLLPPPHADGTPRRILVPFSGAGSEMIGCLRAGWDEVVGIEMDPQYVADAEERITELA